MEKFGDSKDLPTVFSKNKSKWCSLIIKSPKL